MKVYKNKNHNIQAYKLKNRNGRYPWNEMVDFQ